MRPGEAAQAVLREEFWQRIESEWTMLTAADVQSRTGTTDDPRSFWVLAVERPYGRVYPSFQLVEVEDGTSRVAPAWVEMLDLLAPTEWSEANTLLWSASVSGWLEGRTPADEIQARPERVTDALRVAIERAIPNVKKKRWAEHATDDEPR